MPTNLPAHTHVRFKCEPAQLTGPALLQLVGTPIGPANLVLGLPLHSPLTTPLSDAILQLRGNGVIDQLKRRWVDDLDQCSSSLAQARTQTHLVVLMVIDR